MKPILIRVWQFLRAAVAIALLTNLPLVSQTASRVHEVREAWQGIGSSNLRQNYSLSIFGAAELSSPNAYRNSEFFAGASTFMRNSFRSRVQKRRGPS